MLSAQCRHLRSICAASFAKLKITFMPENKNPNQVQKKKPEVNYCYAIKFIDSHLWEFRLSHKRSLVGLLKFPFFIIFLNVLLPNEFVSLLFIKIFCRSNFHTFGNPSNKDRMVRNNEQESDANISICKVIKTKILHSLNVIVS